MTSISVRRTNCWLVLDGEKVAVTEAARRLGLHPSATINLARLRGCSYQEALDYQSAKYRRRSVEAV